MGAGQDRQPHAGNRPLLLARWPALDPIGLQEGAGLHAQPGAAAGVSSLRPGRFPRVAGVDRGRLPGLPGQALDPEPRGQVCGQAVGHPRAGDVGPDRHGVVAAGLPGGRLGFPGALQGTGAGDTREPVETHATQCGHAARTGSGGRPPRRRSASTWSNSSSRIISPSTGANWPRAWARFTVCGKAVEP